MNKINNTAAEPRIRTRRVLKKQDHNIGTHAERMEKRKILRRNRVRSTPFKASSKYIPEVAAKQRNDASRLEDRKHYT
jgi:hypothetical protein